MVHLDQEHIDLFRLAQVEEMSDACVTLRAHGNGHLAAGLAGIDRCSVETLIFRDRCALLHDRLAIATRPASRLLRSSSHDSHTVEPIMATQRLKQYHYGV